MASASTPTNGLFQSTPSGGKATQEPVANTPSVGVSIHAFRGEGDQSPVCAEISRSVSIHAFRGEGDLRESA